MDERKAETLDEVVAEVERRFPKLLWQVSRERDGAYWAVIGDGSTIFAHTSGDCPAWALSDAMALMKEPPQ